MGAVRQGLSCRRTADGPRRTSLGLSVNNENINTGKACSSTGKEEGLAHLSRTQPFSNLQHDRRRLLPRVDPTLRLPVDGFILPAYILPSPSQLHQAIVSCFLYMAALTASLLIGPARTRPTKPIHLSRFLSHKSPPLMSAATITLIRTGRKQCAPYRNVTS